MGAKKGINSFKRYQQEKIEQNKVLIIQSLKKIKNGTKFKKLSNIIGFISEDIGIHRTTITKNLLYMDLCKKKYIEIGGKIGVENPVLEKENHELKLQVTSLKSEIQLLRKIISQENKGIDDNLSNKVNEQQKLIESLLDNFKDYLEIRDGKVIDICGGIREKELGKL